MFFMVMRSLAHAGTRNPRPCILASLCSLRSAMVVPVKTGSGFRRIFASIRRFELPSYRALRARLPFQTAGRISLAALVLTSSRGRTVRSEPNTPSAAVTFSLLAARALTASRRRSPSTEPSACSAARRLSSLVARRDEIHSSRVATLSPLLLGAACSCPRVAWLASLLSVRVLCGTVTTFRFAA